MWESLSLSFCCQRYFTRGKKLSRNAIPTLGLSGIHLPTRETTLQHTIAHKAIPSTSEGFTLRLPLQNVTNKSLKTELPTTFSSSTHKISCNQITHTPKKAAALKGNYNMSVMGDSNFILPRNQMKKLQKQKDSATTRLKKALKLSQNAAFQKALGEFSPTASIFTNLQFREVGKHRMGCRFTKSEKVILRKNSKRANLKPVY